MNSVPIRRAVSRRPAALEADHPVRWPGAVPDGWPNAIVTGPAEPIVLATSPSVLAGTSAEARSAGSDGSHATSRTASLYLIGRRQRQRAARRSRGTHRSALAVCRRGSPTALPERRPSPARRRPRFRWPRAARAAAGYSPSGSATSANSALPQVSITMPGGRRDLDFRGGRLLLISASNRPGTSTVPGSRPRRRW